MAKLTSKARKAIPSKSFAFPKARKYPIEDESHARNALARGAGHLSPEAMHKLRGIIKRKFPSIKQVGM
jgi:hypothetical protein